LKMGRLVMQKINITKSVMSISMKILTILILMNTGKNAIFYPTYKISSMRY
jgi:hypothetical protein